MATWTRSRSYKPVVPRQLRAASRACHCLRQSCWERARSAAWSGSQVHAVLVSTLSLSLAFAHACARLCVYVRERLCMCDGVIKSINTRKSFPLSRLCAEEETGRMFCCEVRGQGWRIIQA